MRLDQGAQVDPGAEPRGEHVDSAELALQQQRVHRRNPEMLAIVGHLLGFAGLGVARYRRAKAACPASCCVLGAILAFSFLRRPHQLPAHGHAPHISGMLWRPLPAHSRRSPTGLFHRVPAQRQSPETPPGEAGSAAAQTDSRAVDGVAARPASRCSVELSAVIVVCKLNR